MAMNQHIDEGLAWQMEDFTDLDGQQYHQYMFRDLFDHDLNYIRRIPFGFKDQDKWAYEAILTKYGTPTGPQMMLEAGQMRSKKEEYFKEETAKVVKVLTAWKADSTASKKALGVIPWEEKDSSDDPLTERELASMKRFLNKHDQTAYEIIFGAPEPAVDNSSFARP